MPDASASPIHLPQTGCVVKSQVSLAPLTSFRVGGPAAWYAAPRTVAELQECLHWAIAHGLPQFFLGAGSNLLISDRGLPGLVIGTRRLRRHQFDAVTGQVTVAAGEHLPRLAWQAAHQGWRGLEWAVGIPGTVGGAVVMNAGAHGGCVADCLVSAEVLQADGTVQTLSRDALHYAYRTSILQQQPQMVVRAVFQLEPETDPAAVVATTQHHLDHRLTTQPYNLPSCGSVFRNPGPQAAGWLIEQAGLKGFQIGGAQVAERHANFIVNRGGATATDILRLIRHVQATIDAQWALRLEPEVKLVGEFPVL